MIDLHNHIIPNLDDGSKSLDISLAMLKYAADQGITDVVNTVHYQSPRMDGKKIGYNLVKDKVNQLQSKLDKSGIAIKLHIGAEVFYLPNLLELKDNPLLTFGHGKYMLIEFPFDQVPNGCNETFFQLKLSGVTPIIAHPERIKPIQKDLSIVRRFIRSGCVIQIDAGSLTGSLGSSSKIAVLELIRQGCCHIMGSDAHDDNHRNFLLAEALEIAKQIMGTKAVNMVTVNPQKILLGEPIETHVETPISYPETIFQKIRRKFFINE
ncbi:MAG: hypothetical protein CMG69_04030 [Candidatus Marinimicrobia bacterium]|nr:hypothetical protein [Candidatus Neomarinimicrobiota bacterium]|tara:strand:+ start:261 stop:1058 length:798 start_codon:yes stop_codon:yes gene_type:complete